MRIVEMEFGGAQGVHDSVKDSELSSRQGTNHDATRSESDGAQIDKANFLGNVHEPGNQGSGSTSSLLVDLGKESISGVGDNGRSHTGNDTGKERDTKGHAGSGIFRSHLHGRINSVRDGTLHDKLGARVRNLLGQNGNKSRVESTDSFRCCHLVESIHETVGPCRVRNGTDTDRFQGTEKDIRNKLGTGRRTNVNGGLVFPGLFFTHGLSGVDLEELDSTELEPSLDKVSNGSGAQTSRQGHGTLFGNDLLESTNQTSVVL
jgi:hypothetical protein